MNTTFFVAGDNFCEGRSKKDYNRQKTALYYSDVKTEGHDGPGSLT